MRKAAFRMSLLVAGLTLLPVGPPVRSFAAVAVDSGESHASALQAGSSPHLLWVSQFTGVGASIDRAKVVRLSPDGSKVFVAGYDSGMGTNRDFATLAYEAVTGRLLWVRRYNGPGNGNDEPNGMALSPDGSEVFVTGNVVESTGDWDAVTFAYDAQSGTPLWSQSFGSSDASDTGDAVAVSADGSTVYVTGSSHGTTAGTDFATAAYEASTGTTLWLQLHDERESEEAEAIALSADGSRVFVTGVSGDAWSTEDYLTVAHDAATGAVLWAQRYDGTGAFHDAAHAIASSPDGSKVFVTGESDGSGPGSPTEFATIAYDAASGALLWVGRYRRRGDLASDAHSVAVSPDGSRVFVSGSADSQVVDGPSDRTLAYDAATGSVIWERRYHGPWYGSNRLDDLAVSGDGSTVVVTGLGSGPTGDADSVTLAYDTLDGTQRWVARFAGPLDSDAWTHSIAVSPDASTVWVVGSIGNGTHTHMLTLAWNTLSGGKCCPLMGRTS
jgi:WD40 repeat protein